MFGYGKWEIYPRHKEDTFSIPKRVYMLAIWKAFGQQLYNSYLLDFISDTLGWIQIKVLTTLPLKFQVFYDKNLKSKLYNFVFFGKVVTAFVQKLKKKICK